MLTGRKEGIVFVDIWLEFQPVAVNSFPNVSKGLAFDPEEVAPDSHVLQPFSR